MRRIAASACLPALLAILSGLQVAIADEPGWTNRERLEKRDVVCIGKVISTEKVGMIDDQEDVHLAVVEVTGMKKGKRTAGSKLNVYYEAAGKRRTKRHPARAELAEGEQGTFYLSNMTAAILGSLHLKSVKEPALFLEMASDVQKIEKILDAKAGGDSVIVSAGKGDGVQVGDVFSVYRDERPIGRLTVTAAAQHESTASVAALQGVEKLAQGDVVVVDTTLQFLSRLRPDEKTDSPAMMGRGFATADIGRDRTRILYYGKPWSQGKPFIDDETGYPIAITEGCIVGGDFRLFVDEYNLAMREHFNRSR